MILKKTSKIATSVYEYGTDTCAKLVAYDGRD